MSEQVLHLEFLRWAQARPDALAVSDEHGRLSYAELAAQAARVAAQLRGAGVDRGPVAVLADRGSGLVAAVLGVLEAGRAFVCLNPEHPGPRLAAVLELVRPGAILVDDAARDRHAALAADVPRLPLDAPAATADPVSVTGADLAYVAFTSGSTGRPKGIPHRHRTLAQFVDWQGGAYRIGPDTRVAQLAPQGFDVSYCEIFGALYRGASLHVAPESARTDPALLATWLRAERVSVLQVVPAHWRALLAELPATGEAPLPDLETVVFVGEVLPPSLVEQTRARLGRGLRLLNVYGPTEVVAATWYEIGELPADARAVPIGHPIPGREIELADLTDGTGEIVVRSPYLTDGYLDDEAGTRERFGPDPARPSYRTGDLARLLPGGELVFAGRTDHQVKISGQRVELEDVEAAVLATGQVSEAVATVVPGADGSASLVAYVVPAPGADLDAARRELVERMPRYLVPAALVAVPQLPRSAHGKLDRAAVAAWPAPAAPQEPTGTTREPAGELEQAITAIWCELLGRDDVAPDADLFALGGDSLLATRLISRVRSRLGVRVTLGAFFEEPTVAGLAAAAAAAPRAATLTRTAG